MNYSSEYLYGRWSVIIKKVSFFQGIKDVSNIKRNIFNNSWVHNRDIDNGQSDWNMRCNSTVSMLDSIGYFLRQQLSEADEDEQDKIFCFVAYIRCIPVGILIFSWQEETPRVKLLSTHPGSRNCGTLLIEQAVNESKKLGKNGVISLSPIAGSEFAYITMGFECSENKELKLKPSESDLWYLMDDIYICKKSI
ncbi:hypothetical protein [Xenorhabdus stockiae]|uniref:hypothetical protein n=1 Tax=Xenorhabdus stockiae TaxID=351614 RepID=UPI0040634DFC